MAFLRPTLSTLIDRTDSDIAARIAGTEPRLRRNFLGVIARTLSGLAHGLYGYLDWLARQLMPDTAEDEHLERWADIWGKSRTAAVAATGYVTINGISGNTVPTGTVLRRGDGAEFTVNAGVTIVTGLATAAVTAVVAGADGNTAASTTLSFVSPLAGVLSTVTVKSGGLSGGADEESDDALRERLLARIRQPPHGGAEFDYKAWALEVAGVTRAWAFPLELGAGTVVVRFVRDADASIIPDSGEVAAVQAYIDELRPVTAAVTVVAPTAVPLNFTIGGLRPATAEVKAAIVAELEYLLRREAKPAGVIWGDSDTQGTILISHIREAISVASGEWDHVLTSPTANVTHTGGQIATMGTVTWT